jgi:hypothetical protein
VRASNTATTTSTQHVGSLAVKPGSLNHLIDINHFRSETVVDAKCRADNGVKEAWKWESKLAMTC